MGKKKVKKESKKEKNVEKSKKGKGKIGMSIDTKELISFVSVLDVGGLFNECAIEVKDTDDEEETDACLGVITHDENSNVQLLFRKDIEMKNVVNGFIPINVEETLKVLKVKYDGEINFRFSGGKIIIESSTHGTTELYPQAIEESRIEDRYFKYDTDGRWLSRKKMKGDKKVYKTAKTRVRIDKSELDKALIDMTLSDSDYVSITFAEEFVLSKSGHLESKMTRNTTPLTAEVTGEMYESLLPAEFAKVVDKFDEKVKIDLQGSSGIPLTGFRQQGEGYDMKFMLTHMMKEEE